MFARWFCILACSPLLVGCAWFHRKRAVAIASAGPVLIGTVALVNEAMRFVLVDVGSNYAAAPGATLKCFNNSQESAVLTASPERKAPFIIADIAKGDPHPGDQVFQ
jgi:CHASE2 domain-containing sensor protein